MEHCETFPLLKISETYPIWLCQVSHVLACEAIGTVDLCWLSLAIALSLQICIFSPLLMLHLKPLNQLNTS